MRAHKAVIVLAVVLALFGMSSLVSCQGQVQQPAGGGEIAPDFTLPDLEGNSYTFSATKGKVVILDFWATWCPPCRMEIPHFQALYEQYKGKGLEIVGVALDRQGVAVVKPFAEDYGITYPVVIGDQKTTASYGGVRGIPTTFVIDRKGRIVEKYVGYRDKEVFEEVIKGLL